MEIVENLFIDCKIKIGLEVVFAIYQVPCLFCFGFALRHAIQAMLTRWLTANREAGKLTIRMRQNQGDPQEDGQLAQPASPENHVFSVFCDSTRIYCVFITCYYFFVRFFATVLHFCMKKQEMLVLS